MEGFATRLITLFPYIIILRFHINHPHSNATKFGVGLVKSIFTCFVDVNVSEQML